MKDNLNLNPSTNDLVSYSRAGDVFHYRWAARRCLKLIQPNTHLEKIIVEGSDEKNKAGEYVMDITEYYKHNGTKTRIEYYQLKHTTVKHDTPFVLSDLKVTIEGFAARYKQHLKDKSIDGVSFSIITNRKIDPNFKKRIDSIVNNQLVQDRFLKTLKRYTILSDKELTQFCSLLHLEDSEGDYRLQKENLRLEMSLLQPGIIDSAQVESITSLVQEKVLPHSNHTIVKEEVLKPFGVTSERQLFPAPPMFEELKNITIRKQYKNLMQEINKTNDPIIISAEGGIGKSVFCKYLTEELPDGSVGIAYDCFGSGKYRSRSEPRHRHRDALVQIVNELASKGLCERMLISNTTLESDIMSGFLSRIQKTIESLKKLNTSAQLLILIDAADNAEMAAKEIGDSCFANELLRESLPHDCKLVLFSRPERVELLKPPGYVIPLKLTPFSYDETFENLKIWYPEVEKKEASEFHRLTDGNPRVQMNAITLGHSTIHELLTYLGPSVTTVEKQIEKQLDTAVQNIKNVLPTEYQFKIDKICIGLASLPPNIPLDILSQGSGVSTEDVRSFIADMGRTLWLLDTSVQFRDEPTESWFRKRFLGSTEDFIGYINALEPIASESTYVAEVLPQLYLQTGQYEKLIDIALGDDLLPTNNPIDKRNVLIYRLQFAFKAALIEENYSDAIKLALRGGEEVAGDQRQRNLFIDNVDLIPIFQSNQKVQEIAFKGTLKSGWDGSENMYAASLLSEIKDFHGEARGYLRSALNWLDIYFKERDKKKEEEHNSDGVGYDDILEFGIVQLNLNGPEACVKFIKLFKPAELNFEVAKNLTERLIDAGRFREIDDILQLSRNDIYYVVAIVSELIKIGKFPDAHDIEKGLEILSDSRKRIKIRKDWNNDNIIHSVVAFLEACIHRNLNSKAVLKVLDHYVPIDADIRIAGSHDPNGRILFLKSHCIRKVIENNYDINIKDILPIEEKTEDKNKQFRKEDIKEFTEVMGGLYPWYMLRARIISGCVTRFPEIAENVNQQSKKAFSNRYKHFDNLDNEIAEVKCSILKLSKDHDRDQIHEFYNKHIKENRFFKIPLKIDLLRSGNRTLHLKEILDELENSTYKHIEEQLNSRPDEIAEQYISLARAVIPDAEDDAVVYFEKAITIVSKFGDELVGRWESLVSLGKRCAPNSTDELAYRFIRCAEMIGEYVSREKHWDRSDAIVTCTKMSPIIGISTLSRWRDRNIGNFDRQLINLLYYLVKSKKITPSEGWSMTHFLSDHHLNDFLAECLKNEPSKIVRHEILSDSYKLLRMEGVTINYLIDLKAIADEFEINLTELNEVLDLHITKRNPLEKNEKNISRKKRTKTEQAKWDRIFSDVDILGLNGIELLTKRYFDEFNEKKTYRHIRQIDFFIEVLNRIKPREIYKYIDLLLTSEHINYYEFTQVIKSVPEVQKSKASFKTKWPSIIYQIGERYAHEIVDSYAFDSVVRELDIDETLITELRKGIFKGLSRGQEFTQADVLFDFVRHASFFINPARVCSLVDYGLNRFELHIEAEFGDGPWRESLNVSNNLSYGIAGFIWSALGSPNSDKRWRACHVIKKLADFDNTQIFDSLIAWLEHDKVDAFGHSKFWFYNLHARQYLLIALSRISLDHPSLLEPHKAVFLEYSRKEPHILIQKFSSQIALKIEESFPGSYSSDEVSLLSKVGVSSYKTKEKKFGQKVDSYLHKNGEIDESLNFRFGWDFDRYWFEPLGDVFGIPGKHIQDICTDVIRNDWKIDTENESLKDSRTILWNQSNSHDTTHSHGSYPKVDNLVFYLSYHSMLVTAAKLLENMPVVQNEDWMEENCWNYWLSKHNLTRTDGKWLSDLRDPLPFNRPKWIDGNDFEKWRSYIKDLDFLNSIKINRDGKTWLAIKGGWTERDNNRYETYYISTALVSKRTSAALMNALATCSNCHDYKIPDFEEDRAEIDFGSFQLKGFILNPDVLHGIDENDPYGANIQYPSFSLGEPILKELGITVDSEGKIFYFDNVEIGAICESWSDLPQGYDNNNDQSGMRLYASLSLLKKLSRTYDSHLIIDINISRDIDYQYRSKKDIYEYNTHHKIYILSEDGQLKSTTENYRLG